MSEPEAPAQDETAKSVTPEPEVSEAALRSVAGGFLDNLNAECALGGGLNLLSSNVALEL